MLRRLIWCTPIIIAMAILPACSEHTSRLPSAPTTTSAVPPATPGAAPGAAPLVLGQTTAQVLTATDPPCGLTVSPDPPEPCRPFAVAVPRSGLLKVRLASSGRDDLTLKVGTQMQWGTALELTTRVEAGSTYGIAVGLHFGRGSQAFELTATLEPF